MKTEVNLITPRKKQTKKAIRLASLVSVFVFAFFFITGVLILSFVIFLKGSLGEISSREDDIKAKINSLSSQKERILLIKDRLSNIQKVLGSRKKLSDKIEEVFRVVPKSFSVDSINASESLMSFRFSSPDLLLINNFLEEDLKNFSPKGIKRIDIKSFGRSSKEYFFTLDFHWE